MALDDYVEHGGYEYRCQGGEWHRRPVERAGLTPLEASWQVLNHGEEIPTLVQMLTKAQSTQPQANLRFDFD